MDEGHQHPIMDCWGSGEVCYNTIYILLLLLLFFIFKGWGVGPWGPL